VTRGLLVEKYAALHGFVDERAKAVIPGFGGSEDLLDRLAVGELDVAAGAIAEELPQGVRAISFGITFNSQCCWVWW